MTSAAICALRIFESWLGFPKIRRPRSVRRTWWRGRSAWKQYENGMNMEIVGSYPSSIYSLWYHFQHNWSPLLLTLHYAGYAFWSTFEFLLSASSSSPSPVPWNPGFSPGDGPNDVRRCAMGCTTALCRDVSWARRSAAASASSSESSLLSLPSSCSTRHGIQKDSSWNAAMLEDAWMYLNVNLQTQNSPYQQQPK